MNYVSQGYVRSGYILEDSDTVGAYTFDKYGKFIFVDEGTAIINLADMWSRFVDWFAIEENMKIKPAMKYSGFDVIPTGFTGATFFVFNGWRVIYNTATTAINGVLFSEDYSTGYWDTNYNPIFPVTVSAVVNTVTVGSGVTAQDKVDIASQASIAVWQEAIRTLTQSAGLTAEESARLLSIPTASENALELLDNIDLNTI